jgi:hypothetical protein
VALGARSPAGEQERERGEEGLRRRAAGWFVWMCMCAIDGAAESCGEPPALQQPGEGPGSSAPLDGLARGRGQRRPVRVVQQCTAEHFRREVVKAREPALLRGLPVGPCVDLWTPEHLVQKGGRKDVSVHVSPHDRMDFISKNFKYHTLPFDELVRRAAYGCAAPSDDALQADHDHTGGLPALGCSKTTPNPQP